MCWKILRLEKARFVMQEVHPIKTTVVCAHLSPVQTPFVGLRLYFALCRVFHSFGQVDVNRHQFKVKDAGFIASYRPMSPLFIPLLARGAFSGCERKLVVVCASQRGSKLNPK